MRYFRFRKDISKEDRKWLLGMSIKRLADVLDMNYAYIRGIISGCYDCPPNVAKKISYITDCELDLLFELVEEQSK